MPTPAQSANYRKGIFGIPEDWRLQVERMGGGYRHYPGHRGFAPKALAGVALAHKQAAAARADVRMRLNNRRVIRESWAHRFFYLR
jgi:hypothetical protein